MAMTEQHQYDANKNINISSSDKPLNPDSQDYWYYCSHSYIIDDANDKNITNDKDTTNTKSMFKYHKDKSHARMMDSLICNSYDMLNQYFDPKLYPNNQIPYDLFQGCKGIMFLRLWKGGIVLGGIGGTGIVIARDNGRWSNPCAVSIGGIQLGLQVGVERVDDILLLRDDTALRLLMEKGQFKMSTDASIAAGPFGRDANSGIVMSGGQSKSIYSYSFAKGVYIGLSFEGAMLSINDSVNEEFYNRKVTIRDIFYGDLVMPQSDAFLKLQHLLNNYSLDKQQSSTYPTINQ